MLYRSSANLRYMRDMNKEEFVDWWIQTQSGHSENQPTFWDRKGQRADIWADFKQVAYFITGQPKVMCKHCELF
jgi:hypothetical protein